MTVLTKENILQIVKKRTEIDPTTGRAKTNAQIAKEMNVHASTIMRWTKKLRESGRDVPKRKGGLEEIKL